MVRLVPLLPLAVAALACTPRPPAPVLTAVNPPVLFAEFGGPLVLEGEGFLPAGVFDFDRPDASPFVFTTSAFVEQGGVRIDLVDVAWRDARAVDATLPPGLTPGPWTVTLVTPRGQTLTLADGLVLEPFITDAGLLLDGGYPDGGAPDAGAQPCETFTFRDDDADLFGAPDSGDFLCGPGRAPGAGDCNDVDYLASPSGREVCNGLDDDCDGLVDELGCADAGFRRLFTLEALDNDFRSASAFTAEQLWVTGDMRLYVRREDGGFRNASANCPMNLSLVLADPDAGRAFVGGGNNGVGRLTAAEFSAGGCPTSQLLPEPTVGMHLAPGEDGGTRLRVIMRDGRQLAPWDGASAVSVTGEMLPSGFELRRAAALPSGAFLGVGGADGPPLQPIVIRANRDGSLVREVLPPGLPDGWLRDVWALDEDQAIAVGDRGMVLRRRWGRWDVLTPPALLDFTSVRAFSVGRFYTAATGGALHQWNGAWTSKGTAARSVYDITGVDEEHLWYVGDDGLIFTGAPVP